MGKRGVVLLAGCLWLWPGMARATMDGSLASLGRDAARLSMETGAMSPCPLPPGMFSAIEKGQYPRNGIGSLCVYGEMVSYLHHTKIREYFRLLPPEKVFAIYWEGPLDPKVFLGLAASGLKPGEKRWRVGRFLYERDKIGTFVVDTTLIPEGLDPKILAP
ncbi:MAG: hypothetical protein ACYDBP_14190 [Leptospirales bacterium]